MIDIHEQCQGKWKVILQNYVSSSLLTGKHIDDCPFCGKGTRRFRWDRKLELFYCNQEGCIPPIDAIIRITGMTFPEVCADIRSKLGNIKMNALKPIDTEAELKKNQARIECIRKGLKRLTGNDLASHYLKGRGITVLPKNDVYFHPRASYWEDNKEYFLPAMVSIFRTPQGEGSTMQLLYLSEYADKADISDPKKTMPVVKPMAGGAVRMFPITEQLIVGEGIVTTLSAYQEFQIPAWAALNAHQVETIIPPETVKEVLFIVDEDESWTGLSACASAAKRLTSVGKRVNLIRLSKDGRTYTETPRKIDFNDYINRPVEADKKQISEELKDIAETINMLNDKFGPVQLKTLELPGNVVCNL